jgi:hypothetical protein
MFQIRCLEHVLQLAVQEGLKYCPVLDAAIGHFRDLVKKIIDSPKLLEYLSVVCSILKVSNKMLELDFTTRWNNTWDMVIYILALKPALLELLRRIRERHEGYIGFSIGPEDVLVKDIDQITWSALEDFCAFLKVFKDATELMSGSEYPTLGLVVPVYFILEQHVPKATDASNGFCLTHTMRFANAVKRKLPEYKEVVNQKRVVLSSSLDPRVK